MIGTWLLAHTNAEREAWVHLDQVAFHLGSHRELQRAAARRAARRALRELERNGAIAPLRDPHSCRLGYRVLLGCSELRHAS